MSRQHRDLSGPADAVSGEGFQAGTGKVRVQGENGQSWTADHADAGERSLDVGVVASGNPNSDIVLYTGSGNHGNAQFDDLHGDPGFDLEFAHPRLRHLELLR